MSRVFLPHVITDDSALGGRILERSVRFNTSDSTEFYNNSLGTSMTGNRQICTISVWFKRVDSSSGGMIEYGYGGSGASAYGGGLKWDSSSRFFVTQEMSNSTIWKVATTRVFRDFNTWYHVVVAVDTTQSTASNRVKIYINGVQQTDFSTETYPSENYSSNNLGYNKCRIGASNGYSDARYYSGWNGYLAEYHFIDGQYLDPSYFGYTESQTGIWRPKKVTGVTYGNNGHYLDFKDNTSTTTLGYDRSGNGLHFSNNNLSVSSGLGNDSFEDTPTNNFPTLNPNHAFLNGSSSTAEHGNLQWNGQSNNQAGCPATMAFPKTGKWYWEVKLLSSNSNFSFGITPVTYSNVINPAIPTGSIGYAAYGSKIVSGSETASWAASFSNSDNIGAALDMENKSITFYKNNSAVGTINLVSGYESVNYLAWIKGDTASQLIQGAINFGGNGFVYTPPTGFKALNSENLLQHNDPLIIRPQRNFDTLLWTGDDAATRTIGGLEFEPDFVWLKDRSDTNWNRLQNSVVGANKLLYSNSANAEATDESNGHVNAFTTDGFIVDDASGTAVNGNGNNFVAWCWKAGGAAVSNSDGTITSSVSANQESGFSIVTYTGNGSGTGQTVGHGLGKAPKVIFLKKRNAATNWFVYHGSAGNGAFEGLNTTSAYGSGLAPFNTTAPSSTVVTLGNTDGNQSGINFVLYCWAEIPGYSKFGTYTGNGNSDGSFLYLGFRPALVIIKRVDDGYSWYLIDSKRDPENQVHENLYADQNIATYDYSVGDFLSTGIKFRNTGSDTNSSGATMIYMAWAEQPGTTPFDTFPNGR